jgi:glycosyltransferase involved in cell wall biosynthesis
LVPYKRIDLAIAACRQLGRRLVVIGQGPQRTRLERLAGGNVRFLGWQSNEVIRDHLRRCRALVFPGLEDFGIVPLEAQACGAPVIAYGQGGATETVVPPAPDAPGTGLLFKPQTVDALCAAMLDLERAPDRLCGELARANAERFQVWRYEREMLACLSEVAVGTFNDRRPARARRCAIPPRSE